MRRDVRFWRNVALITLIHVGAVIALLRWAGASKIESGAGITWLNTDNDTSAAVNSPEPEETPTPTQQNSAASQESRSTTAPAKSEIELPAATPHPTPSATASPKPTPKPSPKKKASPKPTAAPEKKKSKPQATPARDKENSKKSVAKKETKKSEEKARTGKNEATAAAGPRAGAVSNSANAGWYGDMLHDRFYREWAQPTTVVASGAKLSALAKIRIEKDGRITDFRIVRSSGNVVIDESIEAVGKKVTRVDALPAGVGNGGHYDVNINFAFNSK